MALRFILFDLVGTLLDERSDHEALDAVMKEVVVRYALKEKPGELSGRFALALMGIMEGEPDIAEGADFVPFHEAAPEIFAGLMATLGFSVTVEEKAWFWKRYLDIQRDEWKPYREARAALEALHEAGFILGAVTDADRYLLDDILPRTPLFGLLPVTVSAEEAGHVKPHPAPFRLALERAGCMPGETMMVGDSYERDLVGAKAAGITEVVLIDRHKARTVDVPTMATLRGLPRHVAARRAAFDAT